MVIRMTVLVPFRYPTVVLPVPLQIPHLYCSYLYALYKYDIKNLEYLNLEYRKIYILHNDMMSTSSVCSSHFPNN